MEIFKIISEQLKSKEEKLSQRGNPVYISPPLSYSEGTVYHTLVTESSLEVSIALVNHYLYFVAIMDSWPVNLIITKVE